MAEKILGFRIEVQGSDESLGKVAALRKELFELRNKLSELKDATKDNLGAQKASAGQFAELEKKIKDVNRAYNQAQGEIQTVIQNNKQAELSYNDLVNINKQLHAQLKALPGGFDESNQAAQQLKAEIAENTAKLQDFDAAIGNHQRNVGNYPETLAEVTKGAEQAFKSFAKVGEGIAAGFAVAPLLGFGEEMESLHEIQVKAEKAIAVTIAAKSVAEGAHNAVKLIGIGQQKVAIMQQGVENALTSKSIVVRGAATVAQRVLNATMAANPVLLLIGLLAGAAAAFAAYGSAASRAKRRQEEFNAAIKKRLELMDASVEELERVSSREVAILEAQKADEMIIMGARIGAVQDAIRQKRELIEQAENDIRKIENAKAKERGSDERKNMDEKIADFQKKAEEYKKALQKHEDEKDILSAQAKTHLREQEEESDKEIAEKKKAAREKRKEEEAKAAEERKRQEEEYNNLLLSLSKQYLDGQVALMADGLQKEIELARTAGSKEILDLKNQIIEKKNLSNQEIQINEAIGKRIEQVKEQTNQRVAKIQEDGRQKDLEEAKKQLDIIERIEIAKAKRSTDIEKEKQSAVLDVQIKFAQQRLDELKKSGDLANIETVAQIEELTTQVDELLDQKRTAKQSENQFYSYLSQELGIDEEQAQVMTDKAFEIMEQVSDMLFGMEKDRLDRSYETHLAALEDQKTTDLAILQERLDQGQITEAQFQQQKEFADKQFRAKEEALKKEKFQKEKQLALKQLAIDTAIAIGKIWATHAANPIMAGILTAASAITFGIQSAAINAQKYARGGLLDGPGTETSDSIPIMASKGESVINARSTKLYRPLLSAINEAGGGRRFATGGIPLPSPGPGFSSLSVPSLSGLLSGVNQGITANDLQLFASRIIEGVSQGVNDKQVVVTEKAITRKQRQVQVIEQDSTW